MTDKIKYKTLRQAQGPDVEEKLHEIERQAEEYLAGWKRAKADYANLKKQTEENQFEIIKFANKNLILEILPIHNNFKYALSYIPADQLESDWVVGLKHIKNQLDEFLRKMGVEEIKTEGEKFDPNLHEAITQEKRDNLDEDTIIKELEAGYILSGQTVRPAKVIVSFK
ncbi:MAG: nucleotide exchange factor GrpE [Patescibacteria group bacterium]